jgi:hypothetical protein
MTCAKQVVKAILTTKDGEVFHGENSCENPQKECPRDLLGYKSGEGYELCKSICNQGSHAEVGAIKKAGVKAKGASIILIGHSYACDDCKSKALSAGVLSIGIQSPLAITNNKE